MCQIVFYYLRYALKNKNILRNQKLKSYQRIKSWPPTDEKAMPLQFNEKKRTINPCVQTPVREL